MTVNVASAKVNITNAVAIVFTAVNKTIFTGITVANKHATVAATVSVWITNGGVDTYIAYQVPVPINESAVIAGGQFPKVNMQAGDVLKAQCDATTNNDVVASYVEIF